MPKNNGTYREQRFSVEAGKTKQVTFRDTKPNYFVIMSSSNTACYVSESAGVNAQVYDIIIPPFGTRIFAKPNSMAAVYFFAAANVNLFVGSMEAEFDPSMISQTQEIAASVSGGLLGIVNVDNLLHSLPAGTNVIGGVTLHDGAGEELFSGSNPGIVTEASAAAILAKLSEDPSTETTLAAVLTKLGEIETKLNGTIETELSGRIVSKVFSITPDDNNDLAVNALSLTCNVDGLAYVDFVDGGTNIPILLIAGYWNPIKVKRVRATNTVATGIVGQEA